MMAALPLHHLYYFSVFYSTNFLIHDHSFVSPLALLSNSDCFCINVHALHIFSTVWSYVPKMAVASCFWYKIILAGTIYVVSALYSQNCVCGWAHRGRVCGFLVFWLQIAIKSFALYHHRVFGYMCFTVIFHTWRAPIWTKHIFVIWSSIRMKDEASCEYVNNFYSHLPFGGG